MHILIIDDDPIINFVTRSTIKNYDNQLVMTDFTNSELGLQFMLCNDIDILLLDLNMPVLSGWEILEEIEKRKLDIPVYILTSSISEIDMAKAYEYSCVKKFISKPIPFSIVPLILSKDTID